MIFTHTHHHKHWLKLLTQPIAVCAFSLMGISLPSGAETAIEEVVVTTQYRKERHLDIPLSTSLYERDNIALLDLHDNQSLASRTPGLSHAPFAPAQSLLAIRGILSVDDGPGMDSSVTVFLDGVYIGRLSSIDLNMYDIQRIEVLKGPQGTLFGRNAIGGVINIITAAPSTSALSEVNGSIGNLGTRRWGGFTNAELPINTSGTSAVRLSYQYRENGAYVHNAVIDEGNQDRQQKGIRLSLSHAQNTHLWRVSIDTFKDQGTDMGRFPVTESRLGSRQSWMDHGGREGISTAPISGFSDRSGQGLSLTHDWQSGNTSWKTIIASRQSISDWAMASTGAPLNFPTQRPDTTDRSFGIDLNNVIGEETNQHSLETRWTQNWGKKLNTTLGWFSLQERTQRDEQYQLVEHFDLEGALLFGNEASVQDSTSTSHALYGQVHFDLSQHWKAILGARYTYDHKRTYSESVNCALDASNTRYCAAGVSGSFNIMSSVFQASAQNSWNDLSPRVALQFQPNTRSMLYASMTKGFKSGGFPGSPGSATVAVTPVAPEEAWSYEIGLKAFMLQRTLRLHSHLFYTDYSNLQIVRFGPSPENPNFGSFTTTNIGQADISGSETSLTWNVSNAIRFDASYAYLHSKIHGLVIETTGGLVDASGSELRQAPRHSYDISAKLHIFQSNAYGSTILHLSHAYTDEQLSDYINRDTRIETMATSNVSLIWKHPRNKLSATLWANNLEDERRIAHSYTLAGGVYGVWSPPRTFGLTVHWRTGEKQ